MPGFRIFQTICALVALLASASARAESCLTAVDADLFKRLNPSAALSRDHYVHTDFRNSTDYASALLKTGESLKEFVPEDGVILDLGSGRAQAMYDLVSAKKATAIAVNTQDYAQLYSRRKTMGDLIFKIGWAEEILPQLKTASVDRVVDLWGAFSYSVLKVELLEEVYRLLKPGGEARILLHTVKAPASVRDGEGRLSLDRWLARKMPEVFSSRGSSDVGHFSNGRVIEIRKPLGAAQIIDLGLRLKKEPARALVEPQLAPALTYEPRP